MKKGVVGGEGGADEYDGGKGNERRGVGSECIEPDRTGSPPPAFASYMLSPCWVMQTNTNTPAAMRQAKHKRTCGQGVG